MSLTVDEHNLATCPCGWRGVPNQLAEFFGAATCPRCLPDAPLPGRNDPCPCGSGRKYKKCCT